MHNLIIRRSDTCGRVVNFCSDNPINPSLPTLAALLADLGGVVLSLGVFADDQEIGRGQFRGGTSYRRFSAGELKKALRPVNRIGRTLKPEQYPGMREKFRMPSSGGYRGLIAGAQAFLEAIGPIKAVFVGRGLPADFDEVIQSKRTELINSVNLKETGRATQVGGTAGLLAKSREGIEIVRDIDSILSAKYESNPALLAAWKSACRVERETSRAFAPVPTSGSGAGTGDGSGAGSPTPPPAGP